MYINLPIAIIYGFTCTEEIDSTVHNILTFRMALNTSIST